MSRRGAVKINPVTGKMEKMTEEEVGVRDGCMKLDEKYINAAKDLGLGGGDGASCKRRRPGMPRPCAIRA